MIVKLTAEQIAKLGAKDPADATVKLSAFFAAAAQLETVMAEQPTPAALETRIAALEKVPRGISAEDAKALFATETTVPIKAFLAGAEGKQLIGAEASRITMEAIGSIGTTPNKPSPAAGTQANDVSALEAAGKFEEAFAASVSIQAEFPDAKCYAAFRKAQLKGQVKLSKNS